MGRIFLEKFYQDEPDYYMCKICGTPIAKQEYYYAYHVDLQPGGIFTKGVNIQVDPPAHHREVDGETVADVYCINCGDCLGIKYIEVDETPCILLNGMLNLKFSKLLIRRGFQLLDGQGKQIQDYQPLNPTLGDRNSSYR